MKSFTFFIRLRVEGVVVNRCHLRLDVHSIEVMLTVPLKLEASVQFLD